MKNLLIKTIPFRGSAFDLLRLFQSKQKLFYLDSALNRRLRGRFSFIGFDPFEWIEGKDHHGLELIKKRFNQKEVKVKTTATPFPAGLMGCLSYDYGLYQDKIGLHLSSNQTLPLYAFGFYDCILTVDHADKKIIISGLASAKPKIQEILELIHCRRDRRNVDDDLKKIRHGFLKIKSNFTKEKYLKAVKKALRYIESGEIYQVNLSQRFEMKLPHSNFDRLKLYQVLRYLSPSDFGCYLDAGRFQIISNSPERFLHLRNRKVETSPMKGTCARGRNPKEDKSLKQKILNSRKDKAELLMVTDLERNDLGKVCQFGSVKVKTMREIEKYQYVYQATSTIEGTLGPDKDGFDLLNACFPSGSITGCPKIRAMEIIEELEPYRRNFYTGSCGYISFSGNLDFNILIRTLLMHDQKIYFQTGGGIVADSDPEKEYLETLVKAKAMRLSLEKVFKGYL